MNCNKTLVSGSVLVLVLATLVYGHGHTNHSIDEIHTKVESMVFDDIIIDFSIEPEPVVGMPSRLKFAVRDANTNKPLKDINFGFYITLPEEGIDVFSGNFYSLDGKMELIYHFQDASRYEINIQGFPTEESSMQFSPFSENFNVDVAPPETPISIWIRTWTILMGVIVIGIGIGFISIRRFAR